MKHVREFNCEKPSANKRVDEPKDAAETERDFYRDQAGRLAGKEFAPTVPASVSELVDALIRHSQSKEHTVRIVDECMSYARCPDANDIRNVAFQTREKEWRPNKDCRLCDGSGYRSFRRYVKGVPCDFAAKCKCWHEEKIS